jgi:hypothetical protein
MSQYLKYTSQFLAKKIFLSHSERYIGSLKVAGQKSKETLRDHHIFFTFFCDPPGHRWQALVLALLQGHEVVGVAPASAVDEPGALAGGRVKEETRRPSSARPRLHRQTARVLCRLTGAAGRVTWRCCWRGADEGISLIG